jgi:hypothetical protein
MSYNNTKITAPADEKQKMPILSSVFNEIDF